MYRKLIGSLAASAAATLVVMLVSGPLHAAELSTAQAKKMFNHRGCNACHGVDEMRIGPSYRMIAERYASGTADIADKLSKKVIYGGAGAWGIVPMISNPNVSETEADALVRWILDLHKPEQAHR